MAESITSESPRGLCPLEIRSVWTDRYEFKFGPQTLINSVASTHPASRIEPRSVFPSSAISETRASLSSSGPDAGYSQRLDKTPDSAKPAPSPKSRRCGPAHPTCVAMRAICSTAVTEPRRVESTQDTAWRANYGLSQAARNKESGGVPTDPAANANCMSQAQTNCHRKAPPSARTIAATTEPA